MTCSYSIVNSPVGSLKLVAREGRLAAILWQPDRVGRVRLGPMKQDHENPTLLTTERQLTEYFRGKRTCFDVELDLAGTDFQNEVWQALLTIPFGQTRTYQAIAKQIGRPTAIRAVGAANGRNPISIIVPCHRVVGADGALTGFAGGLEAKRRLLNLEACARV